jgi:hypothetical protein
LSTAVHSVDVGFNPKTLTQTLPAYVLKDDVHPSKFIFMHALVRVDLFIKALKPNVKKIWELSARWMMPFRASACRKALKK